MTAIRALYVDDEADMRDIVAMALQLDADFHVETAGTGTDAMILLGATDCPLDVIILDRMMPERSGLQLMAAIRRLPKRRSTPVVFLTMHPRDEDVSEQGGTDAIGAIARPFDPLTLAGEVRRLMKRR